MTNSGTEQWGHIWERRTALQSLIPFPFYTSPFTVMARHSHRGGSRPWARWIPILTKQGFVLLCSKLFKQNPQFHHTVLLFLQKFSQANLTSFRHQLHVFFQWWRELGFVPINQLSVEGRVRIESPHSQKENNNQCRGMSPSSHPTGLPTSSGYEQEDLSQPGCQLISLHWVKGTFVEMEIHFKNS